MMYDHCSLNDNNIGRKAENGRWVPAPEGVVALAEGIAKCQNLQILRYAFAVVLSVCHGALLHTLLDCAFPPALAALLALS